MGNTESSTSNEEIISSDWDKKAPIYVVRSPTNATQETAFTCDGHDTILENRSNDDTILQDRSNDESTCENGMEGRSQISIQEKDQHKQIKQDPDADFLRPPPIQNRRRDPANHVIKLIDSDEDGSMDRPILLHPDTGSSDKSTEDSSNYRTDDDASVELASRSESTDGDESEVNDEVNANPRHIISSSDGEEAVELENFTTTQDDSLDEIDTDEADVEFVAKYERMFDSFLEQYPHLMMNPRLIDILRISKLKKVLESSLELENSLEEAIKDMERIKKHELRRAREKLLRASRKKAEYNIELEQEFNSLDSEMRSIEGNLKWQIIKTCQQKARTERDLYEKLATQQANTDNILSLLPDNKDCYPVYEAATYPSVTKSFQEHEGEQQEIQMDIAFLKGEIAALEKKLAYQMTIGLNRGWIDTVLLQMDARKMKQLKTQIEENVGTTIQSS